MNAAKSWLPIEVFNTMPEAFINAYGWQSPLSAGQLQLFYNRLVLAYCCLVYLILTVGKQHGLRV